MHCLMKCISVKTSCLLGCVLEVLSVAGNAFVTDISQLIFTHGILFGFGQALIYCPAMVILSEYFDKKRPIATVFATGGVSAGGIAMPFLIQYLVESYGLVGGVLITSGVIFQQAIFVSFFTSPSEYGPAESETTETSVLPKPILKKPADKDRGRPASAESRDVNISNSQTPNRRSQKLQDNNSIAQPHVYKESAERNITDADVVNSYLSSQCEHSLSEDAKSSCLEVNTSLYPSIENYLHDDTTLPPSSASQIDTGDKYTLHPEINLTDTRNETQYMILSPENTIPCKQNSKQPLLDRSAEDIFVSKSSINSKNSLGRDLPDHGRGKSHRDTLSPFASNSLFRAMSTSSVDILGSAQNITFSGSTMSIGARRRVRTHSIDRTTDSRQSIRERQLRRDLETSRRRPCSCTCTLPEMVKTPAFWYVAVYFCGGGLACVLPTVLFPPMAESRGLDASYFSQFLVVSAITEMFGRLAPGLVLHFGFMRPSTAVIPSMVLCGILLQLIHFFTDFQSLMVLSSLIGFFTGAFWAMQVLVVIEIIGMESLGQAFGFYSIVLGFGVGAGFPLAGAMVDATGSYNLAYNFFGCMYLLAALMMVLVQCTRRPDVTASSFQEDDDHLGDSDDDLENDDGINEV